MFEEIDNIEPKYYKHIIIRGGITVNEDELVNQIREDPELIELNNNINKLIQLSNDLDKYKETIEDYDHLVDFYNDKKYESDIDILELDMNIKLFSKFFDEQLELINEIKKIEKLLDEVRSSRSKNIKNIDKHNLLKEKIANLRGKSLFSQLPNFEMLSYKTDSANKMNNLQKFYNKAYSDDLINMKARENHQIEKIKKELIKEDEKQKEFKSYYLDEDNNIDLDKWTEYQKANDEKRREVYEIIERLREEKRNKLEKATARKLKNKI